MPSVFLVEDDPQTRARLVKAIEANPGFEVVGSAGTVAEGLAWLGRHFADVLLFDLGLPDGSGLDLIRLAARAGRGGILVISVFGDERNVVSAIEAGASGYLLKDASVDSIGESISQLLDGGAPISPGVAKHLLKRFQNRPARREAADTESLTAREHEVLFLLAKGFSYAEAGAMLKVSINTIRSHVKSIYGKLAVNSLPEAIYEADPLRREDRDPG